MVTTKNLVLDPKGYFIIRIFEGKVEIGFCDYKDMVWAKSNKVLQKFSSKDVNEILEWVKKNKLYTRQDHYEYLERELKRARECLDSGEEYVQD